VKTTATKELRTMMGWYHGDTGWGGWILMTLVMLAFWALVIFAVVAMFRGLGKSKEPAERTRRGDPLDILAERFARGEIDAAEYEARTRVLRDASPGVGNKTAR
jgi:putative membrane protein